VCFWLRLAKVRPHSAQAHIRVTRLRADAPAWWRTGHGTSWLADPACGLTVIVLTQRMFESSDLPQVHRDIQAAAQAALA